MWAVVLIIWVPRWWDSTLIVASISPYKTIACMVGGTQLRLALDLILLIFLFHFRSCDKCTQWGLLYQVCRHQGSPFSFKASGEICMCLDWTQSTKSSCQSHSLSKPDSNCLQWSLEWIVCRLQTDGRWIETTQVGPLCKQQCWVNEYSTT